MDITGKTKICAIIADPIHHVKTPQGINRLCEETGKDAVMVPVHVSSKDLVSVVNGFRAMQNLAGFVITVPHKTAVAKLCDELSDDAARMAAVNVIRRSPDGKLHGAILDGKGFVAGLREEGIEPEGLSAYLVGAGGAASAIAYALAEAGVSRLTLANRTQEKAEALRKRLDEAYPALPVSLGGRDPKGHDLVINATSLGLKEGDPLPLDVESLMAEQIVAEIIMEPAETSLLKAAKNKGCTVQYGLPMLKNQLKLMAETMGL
ncbi:shikimate dehydrogenase [Halomonas meridiana]|uniref:shikimate dehydrogenase family protein n=1 Tax=Vreelandella aquamarina TaxID=77097 RepID=UPI001E2D2A10|nr:MULTISPECIES: shikimate dehydrogenase [Halomonas]MCD1652105.1 shikimate dehydrogenase [Halomonas axialensis]MCD2088288.1 shikimate dehydrogenase [Halomonas meridiana]